MSAALDRFVELLQHADKKVIHGRGDKITFSCPCHEDDNPSAGAETGTKVPLVALCQVCGTSASLPTMLDRLGASEADRELILGPKSSANGAGAQTVHHVYRDAAGLPVFRLVRKVRYGKTEGKPLRQYYYAGAWSWPKDMPEAAKPNTRELLYNARQVIEAAHQGGTVHVGEGERVVDALVEFGFPATCNVGGASDNGKNQKPKWLQAHADQFRGTKAAVIWEDTGSAGRSHGSAIAATLLAIGVGDIRVVRFADTADNYDVVDWLEARRGTGLTKGEVRAELLALVAAAPRWEPPRVQANGTDPAPAPAISSGSTPVVTVASWPAPATPEAFHGLAGDWVRLLDPHTEADRHAVLVQFLVAFGSVLNRGPHFEVESDTHGTNLFAVICGESSNARKGTSWGHIRRLFRILDEEWATKRIATGLSSGEGLIWAVRDPIEKQRPIREHGRTTGYEQVVEDEGVTDKRLLVVESEFASPLTVMAREGNTLSPILRAAWDTDTLRSLTKNSPATATGAHISIIGHVTQHELRRELSQTDMANGFANRFLWVCVKRSKALAEGGHLDDAQVNRFAARVGPVLERARRVGRVERDEPTRQLWAEVYPDLSDHGSGLLGAVVSRAEAQVTRLSLLYALLDRSAVVGVPHLRAALALWDYCARSAAYIFGTAPTETDEDRDRRRLVEVIAGRGGEVSPAWLAHSGPVRFRRKLDEAELALNDLASSGRGAWIDVPPGPAGGRPTRRFRLAAEGGREQEPPSFQETSRFRFCSETQGSENEPTDGLSGGDLAADVAGEVEP